jgi:peptidyl-prolyl cis-trans isomerase D
MLEAIRARSQSWIAKVILILLLIPFALWGIDSYFSGSGREAPVATIGDEEISPREFAQALRDQQEALGGRVEEKALRKQVMDQLVNVRLLTMAATRSGFSIADPQVHAVLADIELFRDNGEFSEARMDAWLRSRGQSRAELLKMIEQDMLLQQVQIGYGEGALVARPTAVRIANILGQTREVNEAVFDAAAYRGQVAIDDKAVAAEYQANQDKYATPEQVRVQYLTLSLAAIESGIQIDEARAREFHEANIARFSEPDQRAASHILIKTDSANAKATAERLFAEVSKSPEKFAELARKHSEDPGSAVNGGDLGPHTRGVMVKPFEEAVWSMKPGEIRGPVESQFGYHIIRLDRVLPGTRMGFEVVRDEILREMRRDEAQRRFADAAERFGNLVYEQPDSLEPAAREFGLRIEESGWLSRGGEAQVGLLGNPRLIEAVFHEDAVKQRQNSEAVEVAPNTLISARVLEHRPAGTRPFEDVAGEIRERLIAEAARKLAVAAGNRALQAARGGNTPVGLSAPMTVSRVNPLNLSAASIKAIFRADGGKLPTYVGAETSEGYRVYRVNRILAEDPQQAQMAEALRVEMRRMLAQEELRAYIESLKNATKIKITDSALDPKD